VETVDVYHMDMVDVKHDVDGVDTVDVHHVDRVDVEEVDRVDVSTRWMLETVQSGVPIR
jgi:hypothetical protein